MFPKIKSAIATGVSLRHRLFLLLMVLVFVMVFVVFLILLFSGTFAMSLHESEKLVYQELTYIAQDISDQYGCLSVQAVELSQGLSESMEKTLSKQGLKVADLQDNPHVLEDILENEYERILFSLQKSKSSGIFVILAATVNPDLENAHNSRAGIYVRNMEPNIINSTAPNISFLRGSPKIARSRSLPLDSQWAMEFNVSDAPYYWLPQEQAAKKALPLSRLYYWNPAMIFPGTSEEVMLCSIPLVDSKGNVLGVCGFEVSSMLFKLAHLPDNRTYDGIFSMLSPLQDNALNTSGAFFAGNSRALNRELKDQALNIEASNNSFHTYRQDDAIFAGFHQPIDLYPKGSPFVQQQWVVSLLLPKQNITSAIFYSNLLLTLICMLLVILGIILSFFISSHYIKPITEGIELIKSNNLSDAKKVKVPEVDDLIEFLSLNDNNHPNNNHKIPSKSMSVLPGEIYEEFVKNTKYLSPAEKAVFDLYVQGHTAKEITQILCISINTVKTHNKRIYMKLNVASREDLLQYVNMLKEMGKDLS